MSKIVEKIIAFFLKTMHVIFISYPQYLLGIMEVLFSIKMISNIFNISDILSGKAIVIIPVTCSLLMCLFSAIVRFVIQKKVNYGSFKINYDAIKEQLDDTEGNIKGKLGVVLTFTRKLRDKIQYIYFILAALFIICDGAEIGNSSVNILGSIFAIFLGVCEISLNSYVFSPFLFFLLFLMFIGIVNSFGNENTVLNWSFLLFIFGTIIGSNFFESSLVKGRFSKKITERSLILRKISFYIGLIYLYISIVLSNSILNSTIYYIKVTSVTDPMIFVFKVLALKCIIFVFVFFIYLGTEKKIMYLIFRFYYRENRLKNSEYLVKVTLDSEGKWKVNRKSRRYKDLNNLKRIGINTYQGKEKNEFYVEKNSEIPEKIEGVNENNGKNILGVVNVWTISWLLVMIPISIIFCYLDSSVKVDNGIYTTVEKSDNTDSSDIIEISDDTIIYNGKAETFDTRKQSFSMGKIEKNNGNNITIKFYKNGKEVQYKKD